MTTGEQEPACEPKKLASLEKMPDVIWAITGATERFDGVWDDYQWSDSRGTKYLRAEPVEELLKQARDVLHRLRNDATTQDHVNANKTITAIDKFIGEK